MFYALGFCSFYFVWLVKFKKESEDLQKDLTKLREVQWQRKTTLVNAKQRQL